VTLWGQTVVRQLNLETKNRIKYFKTTPKNWHGVAEGNVRWRLLNLSARDRKWTSTASPWMFEALRVGWSMAAATRNIGNWAGVCQIRRSGTANRTIRKQRYLFEWCSLQNTHTASADRSDERICHMIWSDLMSASVIWSDRRRLKIRLAAARKQTVADCVYLYISPVPGVLNILKVFCAIHLLSLSITSF
jgi:hypothetical protein